MKPSDDLSVGAFVLRTGLRGLSRVEAVEPRRFNHWLHAHSEFLLTNQIGQVITIDQINGWRSVNRLLPGGLGVAAQSDEDRALRAPFLGVVLKQRDFLARNGPAVGIVLLDLHRDAR